MSLRTLLRETAYRLVEPFDSAVRFQRAIEFNRPEGVPLNLNLARPRQPRGPYPAVLCIHGGGFRLGHRDRWNAFCRYLARRGYVAATASYRFAPAHPFPAAVDDVRSAAGWLRQHADALSIDPARIGVVGDSAGGTLAMMLGIAGGLACVVSHYGPSDLARWYPHSVDAPTSLPLFLGGTPEEVPDRYREASPIHGVTSASSPMLLIHGTRDVYVAHEQSAWMHKRLREHNVASELLTLQGAGHDLSGRETRLARDATVAFLDRHLK